MNNPANNVPHSSYPTFNQSPTEKGAHEYAEKKSGGILFALTILISFIFMRLVAHGGFGYSMPILTALSWLLFLLLIIRRDKKLSWTGIASLLPVMALALCCGIFSGGGLVKFVTLLTMFALTILQNAKISGISGERFFSGGNLKLALRSAFYMPFEVMGAAFSSLKSKGERKKNAVGKALVGILVSLPAVIFLIVYFSLTDAVFRYYVINFIDIFDLNLFNIIFDCIGACIITLFLFPYQFGLCAGTRIESKEKNKESKGIDGVYVASFLGSCMLVYLAFVAIQFGYLFNRSLPADMKNTISYSDYARKGFFELCFIIFLTFLVIVIAMSVTKKNDDDRIPVYVKIVLAVLALSDIIFVVSAIMRDQFYIEAYGMTRARIVGFWFAALLGICTIGLIMKIFFEKARVSFLFAGIAVVMVICLNVMNVDGTVAKYNVDRYFSTGDIDLDYMDTLSLSAGNQILRIAEKGNGKDSREAYRILASKCYKFDRNRKFGSWTFTEVSSYDKLMKNSEIKALVAEYNDRKGDYFWD